MVASTFLFPPIERYALIPATDDGRGRVRPAASTTLPFWARLVTYTFLHAGLLHLAGNMVTLWVFGDNLEDALGHWRYALFFVFAGAAGGLAEAAFSANPEIPVVGASGAVSRGDGRLPLAATAREIFVLVGFSRAVALQSGILRRLSYRAHLEIGACRCDMVHIGWRCGAHVGRLRGGD